MSEADGTIVIDTKIDADGAKTGIKEVESAIKKVASTAKDIRDSVSNYSQEAIRFIEEYAENSGKASKSNNEFKKSIEEVKNELSELEGKGLYFGDEEYDNAFIKLQRLIQAVKDYKKELLSPAPDVNPFDTNTIEGQLKQAELDLQKLYDSGKGLGTPEYDNQLKKVAELTEAYKRYKAEVSKTDAQTQAEADKQASAKAKEEAKINSTLQKLEEVRAKEVQAAMEANRLKAIGDSAEVSRQDIVDLNTELAKLKARQADLKKAGLGSGFKEFDNNEIRIAQIESQLRDYQKSLLQTDSAQKKVTASSKKLSKSLKDTGKSAKSANSGLGKMLGTSILFSFVFQAISGVMNAMKEGFTNLAQYSSSTNNSISILWSSLERLKNSLATAFAPILDVVAPILSKFIDMLSTAASYVSMFFAFLSGKSTYTRAVAVQKDYAASLADTASGAQDAADATNEAADAAEGYLSPLDEINKLDKNDTSGSRIPSSGDGSGGGEGRGPLFEEVEITDIPILEKLKDILSQIFRPFKEAWEKEGKATIDAAKYAFSSLAELAKSVGRSILEVWTNGTGTKMLSTILQIFQGILITVGNIATRLNEAWNTNKVGTAIIQAIADIFQTILGFINNIVWATVDWASNLDFYPLLNSIKNLLESIRPIIKAIGDFLYDIYTSIILPIVTFLIEKALPGIINALSELFEFIGDHEWIIEAIGSALIGAFAASKIVPLITTIIGAVKGVVKILTGASGLSGAISTVVSALGGPLTLAIAAIIAGIVLLITHWDDLKNSLSNSEVFQSLSQKFSEFSEGPLKKLIESISGFLGKLIDALRMLWEEVLVPLFAWIAENVMPILGPIIEFLGTTVIAAISAIITAISGIFDVLSGLIDFIVGVFTADWELAFQGLSEIAEGFKTAFDAIFDFIENNILEPFDKFLSGVFSADWTKSFGVLGNVLNAFFKSVQNIWNSVRQIFDGIIEFIDGVFSGNWRQAWEGIVQIFKGIWNTLVSVLKTPINGVISIINSLLSVVEAAQHWIADALSFRISLPGWVQSLTGASSFSLSVGKVNIPRIPYLASGAVIPPNNEFLAVLGDQKRGNNIEAPEGLIRKIIREELSRQNTKGGSYAFTAQINRRTLFEEFIKEAELQQMRTGKNPLELA